MGAGKKSPLWGGLDGGWAGAGAGGNSGQLLGDVGRGESPFMDSRLYFSSNHNKPSDFLFTTSKKWEPI